MTSLLTLCSRGVVATVVVALAIACNADSDSVTTPAADRADGGGDVGRDASASDATIPNTSPDAALDGGRADSGGADGGAKPDGGNAGNDAGGAAYNTSFTLTENPISEGGDWTPGGAVGLDWNDPKTASGRATASVLSGTPNRYNDSIAALNTTFGANQFAEGTVYRAAGYDPSPSKHEVELLLRFQISAHSARGYEIMWGVTGYLAVVRWNGPLGDYTALYDPGDPGIGPAVDGDVLRAEITGTTLTVFKNGTSAATIDVSSSGGQVWSTGQPGIGFWPVDGATPESYGWASYAAGSL